MPAPFSPSLVVLCLVAGVAALTFSHLLYLAYLYRLALNTQYHIPDSSLPYIDADPSVPAHPQPLVRTGGRSGDRNGHRARTSSMAAHAGA